MFTGLLHTHKLVVILFILIYLGKTALLLANKTELLERFKTIMRIPEIVISVLFLLTGAVMLFQLPEIHPYVWIKIVAVFASIPLAVIGFKRSNKALASLSFALLLASYGLAEMSRNAPAKPLAENVITDATQANYDIQLHGKAIYQANCIACHGADGALGAAGAKNLANSQLSLQETIYIITNGKNAMPKYKKALSEQDIRAVAAYVATFKK
ncbi:MAG: c-type cytochrome [Cytophagales bacterium]|nr:c-type cytochrome [Bernardetiaceae bacterium]MDW8204428.1 c-type cytochrome [Cytophagales bacterium]